MQGKRQFSYEYLSKYRNVLLGLQIILIIVFHFTEDVHYQKEVWIIDLFYRYVRSSGVDMFLLLSGIGLYFSWKKKPEVRLFYKKRYTRILIPYFIVAVPAWLGLDIIYEFRGWEVFIQDILFVTFFTEGTKWFWYILMAAVCYWIFPAVFNIVETAEDRHTAQMRIFLLCVTSTLMLVLLQLYHNELYSNISIAVSRIPAFLIGVLLGKSVYEKRMMSRKSIFLMVILAVLIAWPLGMANVKIAGVYSLAFLNYSLTLLFLLVLVWMSEQKNRWLSSLHNMTATVLGLFGKYTLELYLTHVMVRKVMKGLEFPTWRPFNEVMLIIVSIVLSVIVSRVTEYIQKRVVKN